MKIEAKLDNLHLRAISNTWLQFFAAVIRVLLAVAFIPSGLTKVVGEPFTTLPLRQQWVSFLQVSFRPWDITD